MPSKLWVLIIKTQKKIISTILKKNILITVLNTEKVKIGDVFHIPAARVSAIGAGALLAEIQQKSNIAYRIYDYNRVDPQTGQQIKLHTELALHAINFELFDPYKTNYNLNINESNILVQSPFFKTNSIKAEGSMPRDHCTIVPF
jgi:mannose-6-phosphate isomerase